MYYLTVAQVLRVNTEEHFISLRVTTADENVGHTDTQDFEWQFVMPVSSSIVRAVPKSGEKIRPLRIKDEHAVNATSGFIYYPKEGDIIFVAVFMADIAGTNKTFQPMYKPVLILGQISTSEPRANKHDMIFLDQSGAKIHFNHGWLDSKNRVDISGRTILPLTGHVTTVSNRHVVLSGRKFLPFGLYSHHLEKNMAVNAAGNDPDVIFAAEYTEQQKSAKWSEVFTRKVSATLPYAGVFDPVFGKAQKPLGEDRFLDSPSVEPEEDMKMHDSGWKRIIREDGSEQRYYTHRTELIGKGFKQLSFAPDNLEANADTAIATGYDDTERAILHQHSQDSGVQRYYTDETSITTEQKNIRAFGRHESVIGGVSIVIPATLPTTPSAADSELTSFQAEAGKYKIKVASITLTIDSTGVHIA